VTASAEDMDRLQATSSNPEKEQSRHRNWKLQVIVIGDRADLFRFYVHDDELHFFELREHMKVTKNLQYSILLYR